MRDTITQTFIAFQELGSGLPDSNDKDDTEGWLCRSLALQNLATSKQGIAQDGFSRFKTTMAVMLLNDCLGNRHDNDWIDIDNTCRKALDDFLVLSDIPHDLGSNSSRMLATLQAMYTCLQTSVLGVKSQFATTSAKTLGDNNDSVDCAKHQNTYELLTRAERTCLNWQNRITSVFVDLHKQRSKEFLTRLAHMCHYLASEEKELAGLKDTKLTQPEIATFFQPKKKKK